MIGIMKKELAQYFRTMTGYVFTAVFAAVSGVCFLLVNIVPGSGDIKDYYSAVSPILLFLMPILTMRLFSEEKKQHTDELLLTSPLKITHIILGKYLATVLVLLAGGILILINSAILAFLGGFAMMDTLSNFAGLVLMEGAFLAIGLFVSVLTDSQVIAAVVTYSVLLLLYAAQSLEKLVPWSAAKKILSFISLTKHYEYFTYGIFNMESVFFFLSVIALFLFFSVYALESKRLD